MTKMLMENFPASRRLPTNAAGQPLPSIFLAVAALDVMEPGFGPKSTGCSIAMLI
jgi:hypothetical protein